MQKFEIHFSQEQLADLRQRLKNTRFPPILTNKNWQFGTDVGYLSTLLNYWRNDYDWFETERKLNQYPQFITEINGLKIHFFHIKSNKKRQYLYFYHMVGPIAFCVMQKCLNC